MELARNTVEVGEGEYVPLPDTRVHCVAGPARVTFIRHRNGRVSHEIHEGVTSPVEAAVKKRLKRLTWEV